MTDTSGATELQYYHPKKGWFRGHAGIDLPDVPAYVDEINNTRAPLRCRAFDKPSGALYGEACPVCEEAHLGLDGSCLLR